MTPPTVEEVTLANRTDATTERKHWLDYLTVMFAFVAAVGGIAAAAAGWYQGWVARDAERISNRAYITSTAFQLINYGQRKNEHLIWTLAPIIENTGNTSTRFLEMKGGTDLGVSPRWNFNSINGSKFHKYVIPPRSIILGGKVGFSLGLPQALQPIIAAEIIKYADVFGDKHLTEYCYEFRSNDAIDWDNYPAGQPIRISGMPLDERCGGHNCEDEECGTDWLERAK